MQLWSTKPEFKSICLSPVFTESSQAFVFGTAEMTVNSRQEENKNLHLTQYWPPTFSRQFANVKQQFWEDKFYETQLVPYLFTESWVEPGANMPDIWVHTKHTEPYKSKTMEGSIEKDSFATKNPTENCGSAKV